MLASGSRESGVGGGPGWTGFGRSTAIASGPTRATGPSRSTRLTNAAFLVAAVLAWRLARRAGDRAAQVLCVILGAIGVGSYLFHTHAQVWAMMADVVPIQVFILVYLALATVRFFALPWWAGVLAALAFVPLAAGLSRAVAAAVGPLNGSVSYVPVPVLILAYAALLARRDPETARGLATGAGILAVSLFFRTIDAGVCGGFRARNALPLAPAERGDARVDDPGLRAGGDASTLTSKMLARLGGLGHSRSRTARPRTCRRPIGDYRPEPRLEPG